MWPCRSSSASSLRCGAATSKELLSDQAPPRHPPGACRLPLRVCTGGRQARPPDKLVLPQPRRGHVRRVPAADGGHGLEELPEDLPRGDRRGQDQLPLPGVATGMARLLLGVTGGIAAYKSVELVRLAVKAGHSVRVVQT